MTCNICPNYCKSDIDTICKQNPQYDDENVIDAASVAIDPIEKKPLYHYLPGTKTLSIGTVGCNLNCMNCQNHTIARPENALIVPTKSYTPEQIVQKAIDNDIPSISWTYNEPTIHPKWIINTSHLAKEYDIKTILVTNGYTSQETLDNLLEYVDAVNVDIKSLNDAFYKNVCSGRLEPVLNSVRFYVKNNIHTEITNLLIPGYNDNIVDMKKIINFVVKLSDKIPLHFSAFYPQYKLSSLEPTSANIVYKACDLGQYLGLKYVYPGNVPVSYKNNTYCKNCRHLLIDRSNNIKSYIKDKCACPNCNHKVDIII